MTFKYKYLKNRPQKTTLTKIHRWTISELRSRGEEVKIEYPIGPFSADCYLPRLNAVVEADGGKWHGYPYGTEKDKKRDAYMLANGIKRVYRIWGCDIKNPKKLPLVVDGIVRDTLIPRLKRLHKVILDYGDQHYLGTVDKVNKLSYTVSFPKLNKKGTFDLNGVGKIEKRYYRIEPFTEKRAKELIAFNVGMEFKKFATTANLSDVKRIAEGIRGLFNGKKRKKKSKKLRSGQSRKSSSRTSNKKETKDKSHKDP